MSGVVLRIQLDATGAAAGLAGMRAASLDLRPMLEDIGADLEVSTIERFDTNVAPDGTPWLPSAGATARGMKTLNFRGHLRNSVHYAVDGDSAVEVSEGMEYASVHQAGIDEAVPVQAYRRAFTKVFGRPASGVADVKAHSRHMKIPARPSLGVSEADGQQVEAIAVAHWRRGLAAGGAQ